MLLKFWRFATLSVTMMLAAVPLGHTWRWPAIFGPAQWSQWLPLGLEFPDFPPGLALAWGSLVMACVLAYATRRRGFSHFLSATAAMLLAAFCATRWLGCQSLDLGFAPATSTNPLEGIGGEVWRELVAWNAEPAFAVGALALLLLSVLAETPTDMKGGAFSPAARLRQFWCGWTSAAEEDELTFEQWRSRVFDQRWKLMREAS